jgi:hypothetical protein
MKLGLAFIIATLSVTVGFSQSNECDTTAGCNKLLEANPKSSLAHYRIAEILFRQENYQEAALEFSKALENKEGTYAFFVHRFSLSVRSLWIKRADPEPSDRVS